MREKSEKPQAHAESLTRQLRNTTLLSSPEGRLLLFGAALAFVYILWLGVMLLFSPDQAQIIIGMTATSIMFGRAACMAFGYSLSMGHSMVIPICMIIMKEIIILMLVF